EFRDRRRLLRRRPNRHHRRARLHRLDARPSPGAARAPSTRGSPLPARAGGPTPSPFPPPPPPFPLSPPPPPPPQPSTPPCPCNRAAQTSHQGPMAEPLLDLDVNARAQLALLDACRAVNPEITIVFASTRQIYGRPEYLPVDEKHRIRPVDVNGVDKAAGEAF